jgi:hypothetical protein
MMLEASRAPTRRVPVHHRPHPRRIRRPHQRAGHRRRYLEGRRGHTVGRARLICSTRWRAGRREQAALANSLTAPDSPRPDAAVPTPALPTAVVTTLALIPAAVTRGAEDQTLLHGLLAHQSEHELDVVQQIVRAAQDGFLSRSTLTGFTETLTAALTRLHSFEATYYLLYNAAQTVQATWVTYDWSRVDVIHLAFCKAMQLNTAAYMRYAVASCVRVRDLPRCGGKKC